MKTKVEKEWTFNQPTEEGFYWIEKGIGDLEIVRVKTNLFENTLCATFHGSGNISELIYMKGLKWYGPITPPSTGTMKEEINEKSDS